MKRLLICCVVVAVAASACQSTSSFYGDFSLDETLRRAGSPGLACTEDSRGGVGAAADRSGSAHQQVVTLECGVAPGSLDEGALLGALRREIEAEIASAGGSILQAGGEREHGFFLQYAEGGRRGSITLTGWRDGGTYRLMAVLDERSEG